MWGHMGPCTIHAIHVTATLSLRKRAGPFPANEPSGLLAGAYVACIHFSILHCRKPPPIPTRGHDGIVMAPFLSNFRDLKKGVTRTPRVFSYMMMIFSPSEQMGKRHSVTARICDEVRKAVYIRIVEMRVVINGET